MISACVAIKRRIFIGLLGCWKSGFCSPSGCGSLVSVVGLVFSDSGYIMMLCFKRVGLVSALGCPDVIPARGCWRTWMFVFSAGGAADTSRLLFHVSGCELNPEMWEEVPPNVAPASAAK